MFRTCEKETKIPRKNQFEGAGAVTILKMHNNLNMVETWTSKDTDDKSHSILSLLKYRFPTLTGLSGNFCTKNIAQNHRL